MDARTSMAYSRLGQESPRLSSSPVVEELFDQIFDWRLYCESTRELEPSHLPGRQTPQGLSKLITHFAPPSLDLDTLAISDLQPELYKMKTQFRPDDDTPTTSTSDYSAHSPPELVQEGGSTSPSDHSGSVFLDHVEERPHPADVTLHEVQAQDDEWTYPQTEDALKPVRPGYPSHILVQGDCTGLQSRQAAGTKRRRSIKDIDKRPRQLVDPVQTADVRKNFWSSFAAEEQYLCSGPRFFTGSPRDIAILFSNEKHSPSLYATVQAYRSTNNHDETGCPRTAAFPREKVPSHPRLQRWVEEQIKREAGAEFGLLLQNFLRVYSKDDLQKMPKYDLVSKVHKMNCFFRIWKMPAFLCIDPSKKLVPLPVSVQAQLRSIARKALDRLEYDVFKMLDDCLSQQGSPKADERVAIWVSMWQLMLMYRELLIAYKAHLGQMKRDPSSPDEFITSQTQQHRRLVDNFYPLLAIFYHYQFRTRKSIELSFDWLDGMPSSSVPREDKDNIRCIGQQLLVSRASLYGYIESSADTVDVDKMLWTFVVEHEVKKMNARKRNPKGSGSKSKKSRQDDDELDDQ
ncbi:hypothetical protein UVI_02020800 [Ustilaginoidea virens]|uniref:Uncharacterized protein n=1 Tax=Ustilaginoidea virens TaxID=1159556 RepID=A0A1B5KWS8_USTVR|nr:hypothetical protein UVI_02020800 [Ustilaginoidea virens]